MSPSRGLRRLLNPLTIAGALVSVTAILVAIAILEGDFPEELTDVAGFANFFIGRFGAPGSLFLLYAEESGVPLPVPGDVYVAYLGRVAGGDPVRWVLAWLAVVCVVVAGSSNLYLIARRWGPGVVNTRLAAVVHIDPDRIAAAERWFVRWGAISIIFGRHIPGLRVPITVMAGISHVPYRVFAPSVAVSTAVWGAFWLWLGTRFGAVVLSYIAGHGWVAAAFGLTVIVLVAAVLVRLWTSARSGPSSPRTSGGGVLEAGRVRIHKLR